MKKLITAFVITALLLTLAPATVVYGAAGGVTGQGKGGNTAPTVDVVTLVESGSDTEVTAMTPLSTYRVKVTAGDINTIDDIVDIEFHVYFSSDGNNWDADSLVIFKWTKAGDVWSMENGGAATTWEVVGGSSTSPSVYTGTTGDWYLAFKPGKLAEADATQNWFASATANDENKSGSGSWATGASMGAYSEIAFDGGVSTVVFGDAVAGIEPGQTGYITAPVSLCLTSQVTTNKQYDLSVDSVATWNDGGSNTITLSGTTDEPPATSGYFSLMIDDQQTGAGDGIPKTPEAITSTPTTITGLGTVTRVSTNQGAAEGTSDTDLYMAMSLSLSGIDEVTYSGTITFTVTN